MQALGYVLVFFLHLYQADYRDGIKMKKKLSIGLNYITISCALISIIAIIAMIILFQNPLENKLLNIAIIFCVSLLVVIGLIGALVNYQSAILDETGLTFKSVFGIISFVHWSEIKKISVEALPTLRSTLKSISVKWIIIFTDENQTTDYGGGNKKDSPPWMIKASKRNRNILQEYIQKFCPDISVVLDQ